MNITLNREFANYLKHTKNQDANILEIISK